MFDSCACSKVDLSKVGDVITPLGPWTTSGPLFSAFSQQDLPHQSFVGHPGHMAEPTQLGSLDLEKRLDIQGFANSVSCALCRETSRG